jgi:hypothetical protein
MKFTNSLVLQSLCLLTDPHLVPATRQDTVPPTFWAAVIALNVTGLSFPLLCSAKTKVL